MNGKLHEMVAVETVPQLAKRWGVTRGRMHQLITEGHFGDNAQRLGRDWVILNSPNPFEFMNKKEVAQTL